MKQEAQQRLNQHHGAILTMQITARHEQQVRATGSELTPEARRAGTQAQQRVEWPRFHLSAILRQEIKPEPMKMELALQPTPPAKQEKFTRSRSPFGKREIETEPMNMKFVARPIHRVK